MVTALTGVALVAIATQLFKSLIEAFGLTPDVRLHDPVIWLFAFAIGIAGYIVDAAIRGPLTPLVAESAAGTGLLAAFSAVGVYHLATHAFFDSTPGTATVTVGPVTTTAPVVVTPMPALPESTSGGVS